MKGVILILVCLLSAISWGQDTLGLKGVDKGITITLICSSPSSLRSMPSLAIFIKKKRLLLDKDLETPYRREVINLLNPASIKEIITIKGSEAKSKYGEFGNEGVVEIWLNRSAWKDLPPEILAEFQSIDD